MKKTAVFVMLFFLIASMAYSKNYEVKKKAGQYNVEVKIDRNPPVVGDNNVSIEIKDMSGKYVVDAKIRLEYSMPAMPGMPAMNYKEDAALSGSTYKAVMNLPMAGAWNIEVKIKKDGKTNTVKFNVDAH